MPYRGLVRLSGKRILTIVVSILLVISLGVISRPDPATAATAPMSAQDLTIMFNTYGDAGNHWTGGDNTASVLLPDGRVAWLFADTYLGTVSPDGSRPAGSPMVNNTLVVQAGETLVSTRHGGNPSAPTALVPANHDREYLWAADGLVRGNTLMVLYNRMIRGESQDNLDFTLKGTALATFALPALTLTSVVDLPLGDTISWGSAILNDDNSTYIYGTSSGTGSMRFSHVARIDEGDLAGTWEFWNGSAWTSDETSAARLLSGVGSAFGVIKVGNEYVLLTQDTNQIFNPQFVAYTAQAPTGPFRGPVSLFTAPEQRPDSATIVYDARIHPELARDGKLLISYNVNSLKNEGNLADARLYRPRFVELDWPRPTPEPGTLPAAPAGVRATPDHAGGVNIMWNPVDGATGYRVHWRDVTAGQTHMSRDRDSVPGTSSTIGILYNGHTYEFAVNAINAAGDGPLSMAVTVVPDIAAPAAPTGLSAVADETGGIVVSWAAMSNVWGYDLFRRDLTADETEFAMAIRPGGRETRVRLDGHDHDHEYEFVLSARNGGGESPRSEPVRAKAQYAPPSAPTGLKATSRADATIELAWSAPSPQLWYWVYQRDITAEELSFTKLPLPITTGTSMIAGLLSPGHTYEFKVSAINRGGEGPASGVVEAIARMSLPPAPSNLRLLAGNGQVELTWESPGTDLWYQVYQRNVTAGDVEFTKLPLPISQCCTMTAGFLSNNETYEFKVAAMNQAGVGNATAVVRVTPRAPQPPKVSGLNAIAQPTGDIRLTWTGPNGAYFYEVYQRDVSTNGAFTKLPLPITACCTMTAGFLTNGHVYAYKVVATNGLNGPDSDIAQATSRYAAPQAPSGLTARSGGDGTIDLDWNPTGSGLGYWIYTRDVTAGEGFRKLPLPVLERTDLSAGFLVHGHVYEFKISAFNQGGEGPASAAVSATAKGGLPGKPTNLAANVSDGAVRLTWTASPTANVSYAIYQRDVTANQAWRKLPLPVSGCCVFNGGLLSNGHSYQWKINATNVHGSSGTSNVVSGQPMPPLPARPSNLTADTGNATVRLSWTASSSPNVAYEIHQRDVTAGQSWRKLPYPVMSCCEFNGGLLSNGHTYEWRIAATNMTGESAFSNTVSGRPMPPFPAAPSALSATPKNGGVTLKWTASPTRDVWYVIYQRDATSNQAWRQLPYPVTSCCEFNGGMLINGQTYQWKVAATNLSGMSGTSNVASARPMPPLPKPPTFISSEDEIDQVTVRIGASPTPGVQYRISYRNLSQGQRSWTQYPQPFDVTTIHLYQLLRPTMHAYEIRVTAVNMSGEAALAATTEAIPRRRIPYDTPNRPANDRNGSNYLAKAWAFNYGMSCRGDSFQVICFGKPPTIKGQPITIGDHLFYRAGAAALEEELVCEVRARLLLQKKYGSDVAQNQGPDLLWHEQIHSMQWSRYRYSDVFIAHYAADHMKFEREANLYWGSYKRHPELSSCRRD